MLYEVHLTVDKLADWDIYVIEVDDDLDRKILAMGYETAQNIHVFNEEGTVDLEDLLHMKMHYDPKPPWCKETTVVLYRKPLTDKVQRI